MVPPHLLDENLSAGSDAEEMVSREKGWEPFSFLDL